MGSSYSWREWEILLVWVPNCGISTIDRYQSLHEIRLVITVYGADASLRAMTTAFHALFVEVAEYGTD